MKARKNFIYSGKLKQPLNSRTEDAWAELFRELSVAHQVSEPIFIDKEQWIFSDEWLASIGAKLLQAHCGVPETVSIFERNLSKQKLIDEVLGTIILENVPAFKTARCNSGRPKQWSLAEQAMLLVRVHDKGNGEAYSWKRMKRTAKSVLDFYPRVSTAEHLLRQIQDAAIQFALLDRILKDKLDPELISYLDNLPNDLKALHSDAFKLAQLWGEILLSTTENSIENNFVRANIGIFEKAISQWKWSEVA